MTVSSTAVAPVIAYVGLGSNLASPDEQLDSALRALMALPDTRVVRTSSRYRTAPIGYADQPDFINAVAALETAIPMRALLDHLLRIEREHGRVREIPNGPRTLDLDLLLYGDERYEGPGLTVPHPRMHERAFVMVPLAEIAPRLELIGYGNAAELAKALAAEQGISMLGR
ncbi:MAG: 2-amino-4-hydroxy-6-hydroxymethyldihydropteridine diphosphokinase [Burkholderiales bacterium]|nr:2-amino-4-hydroxy-6-hydroxymethyldihydropteridine diphosphokinase [Burkholderiales bacterium]